MMSGQGLPPHMSRLTEPSPIGIAPKVCELERLMSEALGALGMDLDDDASPPSMPESLSSADPSVQMQCRGARMLAAGKFNKTSVKGMTKEEYDRWWLQKEAKRFEDNAKRSNRVGDWKAAEECNAKAERLWIDARAIEVGEEAAEREAAERKAAERKAAREAASPERKAAKKRKREALLCDRPLPTDPAFAGDYPKHWKARDNWNVRRRRALARGE